MAGVHIGIAAQTTARRNEWPLDKTVVQTEVTKKRDPDEVDAPSRDGEPRPTAAIIPLENPCCSCKL